MSIKNARELLFVAAIAMMALSCQEGDNGSQQDKSPEDTSQEKDTIREEVTDRKKKDQEERLSPPDTAHISVGDWEMSISYGSPSVRDRDIWGGLVPYDKVWRTGANEATNFTTNRPVSILGQEVPAGRYALYTIPGKEIWTLILNKVWNQWGAYEYNENEDILRVTVEPENLNTFTERLSFSFEQKDQQSVRLYFMWENLQFDVPIKKASAS